MARIDTTKIDLLRAIVARLRRALDLPPNRCYVAVNALAPPAIPRGGDYSIAVSPGQGQFPIGEQVHGNITEEWSVWVSVYDRIALDRTDEDESLLVSARGLYAIQQRVMRALVGHDLSLDRGDTALRHWLHAIRVSEPRLVETQGGGAKAILGMLSIEFGVVFDWDVT